MSIKDYFHPPAIAAGFASVLIGYSSSAVIIFQAAKAAGASVEQIGSWMVALGIGMGLTTFGLSWRYRMPIITAWSTPGAALLVTSLQGISLNQAIGAFILSALLITASGISGWFERLMNRIPLPIAAAMLAGILFQFGVNAFVALRNREDCGRRRASAMHASGRATRARLRASRSASRISSTPRGYPTPRAA